MLGGPVYIALIRFGISLVGVIVLFSQISTPRFSRKRVVASYSILSTVMLAAAAVWYAVDQATCVRLVAFLLYIGFAVLAVYLSSDPLYLSLYKIALTFYLLAVFLIAGIEVAILFFQRNVWVDIIVRILLILLMAFFIEKRIKSSIRGFGQYMEQELDRFIIAILIISVLCGIGFILNPDIKEQTPYRFFQILLNFFLTGTLQLLVFRLYMHVGKEQEYRKENQLMQMNQRLLERNMEIMEESLSDGRHIRHDARHHNAVIAEYARKGQDEEILQYLEGYDAQLDVGLEETVCANTAVNNILTAYTRKARGEQISVTLDVELGRDPQIPVIDLVTVLANAYENAIYGCMEVKGQQEKCFIDILIRRKKNKLVVCCRNTCRKDTEIVNGQPRPEATGGVGVLSIIKVAGKYEGEYDFRNDDGVFVFRLIMNIPSTAAV